MPIRHLWTHRNHQPGQDKIFRALIKAIKKGNCSVAKNLLEQNKEAIDINLPSFPPLEFACFLKNGEMIQLLLQHGANPNQPLLGQTLFEILIEAGNYYSVKELLKSNKVHLENVSNDISSTLVIQGKYSMLKLLLQEGLNPNVIVRFNCFVQDKTLLLLAISMNQLKVIKILLKYGADIEYKRDKLSILQSTTSPKYFLSLLVTGFTILPDSEANLPSSAQEIQKHLTEQVSHVVNDDKISHIQTSLFLRGLSYALTINKILNRTQQIGLFRKGISAHITEYYCNAFSRKVRDRLVRAASFYLQVNEGNLAQAVFKSTESLHKYLASHDIFKQRQRQQSRYAFAINVFRGLEVVHGLPAEVVSHIIDYLLDDEQLTYQGGMPLKAMLPIYHYVHQNPTACKAFHHERLTEGFLTSLQAP